MTKFLLYFYLLIMAGLMGCAVFAKGAFLQIIERPDYYVQAKFVHVFSVTLFFANAVIGTIWEARGLVSGNPEIIRHTYKTVTWLDAIFTAPLIITGLLSGIMLGTILGGVWSMGWLSVAFLLYIFTGVVWVVADIPSQYKLNRLFAALEVGAAKVPLPLRRQLWKRVGINIVGTLPLLIIFYLMIYKPEFPDLMAWLRTHDIPLK